MNTATGYLTVCTVVPKVFPGNPRENGKEIIKHLKDIRLSGNNPDIIVFPELSLLGYSIGDLVLSTDIIKESLLELINIQNEVFPESIVIVGGVIIDEGNGKVYNSAFVLAAGKDILCIPKKHLPNYSEFYEKRWFDIPDEEETERVCWRQGNFRKAILVPSGVIDLGGEVRIGIELCEDLWAPDAPSTNLVLNGSADLIINISGSPDLAGKRKYLEQLISVTSAKLICGYLYVSSGPTESSTDLVFSGTSWFYENGKHLQGNKKFYSIQDSQVTYGDFDIKHIREVRRRNKTFTEALRPGYSVSNFSGILKSQFIPKKSNYRNYDPHPFLVKENYEDIFRIQSLGLQRRLNSIGTPKVIIGISGGSDSTLALMVACEAMDQLGRDRRDIIGVTMPCFGTSERTKKNSHLLMEACGISSVEIDISETVKSHLKDLGHDLTTFDIAYENAQARLRTQTLFNLSNIHSGIVLGTGDLSELALGWCTYGGDHLSSYNPNVSIPKTLVRHLLKEFLMNPIKYPKNLRDIISDILDTPVSPELLPLSDTGEIQQISEDTVGPYELHDYFLYHFLRCGMEVRKILFTATWAFEGLYTEETIRKWLIVFLRRFGEQQFKRSCLPDGPKVGSVSLSPRGDWRMPSDINLNNLIKLIEK